jgi:hypothetical protein
MVVMTLRQVGADPDAESIQQVLRQSGNPAIASHFHRFFKRILSPATRSHHAPNHVAVCHHKISGFLANNGSAQQGSRT